MTKPLPPNGDRGFVAEDEGEQELRSLAFAYAKARPKFASKFC